eukprot:320552-Chlamydomonas_euryale.AAC.38
MQGGMRTTMTVMKMHPECTLGYFVIGGAPAVAFQQAIQAEQPSQTHVDVLSLFVLHGDGAIANYFKHDDYIPFPPLQINVLRAKRLYTSHNLKRYCNKTFPLTLGHAMTALEA